MARKFRKGADTLNQPNAYYDNFTVKDNDESWNIVEEGNQIVAGTDTKRPTREAIDDELFKYFIGPIGDYFIMPAQATLFYDYGDKNYRTAYVNQQLVLRLPDYGYRKTWERYHPFSRYQMKDGKVGDLVTLKRDNIVLPDIFAEPRFFISPLLSKTPMELIKNPFKGLGDTYNSKIVPTNSQVSGSDKERNITNDQMTFRYKRSFPERLFEIYQYYPVGENSYIRFTNIFTFQAEGDVYYFKDNKFHKLKMVNGIQCGSVFKPELETNPDDPYGVTKLSRDKIINLIEENEYLRREKIEDVTLTPSEEKYRSVLATSDSTKRDTYAWRDPDSYEDIGKAISRDCLLLAEDEEYYSQKKEGFVVRTLLTKRGRNPEDQIFAATASQKHIFIDELGLIPINDGKVVVNVKSGMVTISGTVINSAANQITPGTYSASKTKKLNSLEDCIVNNDKNTRWFVPMNKPSLEYPIWNLGVYPIPQKLHYVPNERWCSLDEATNTITMLPMEFNYGMWKKFIKFQGGSENAGGIATRNFKTFAGDFGTNLTKLIEPWFERSGFKTEIDITWYPWIFKNNMNTFMPSITLNNHPIDPTYFIKTQGIRFNVAAVYENVSTAKEIAEAKQYGIWNHVKRLEFVLDTTAFSENEQTGEIYVNAKHFNTVSTPIKIGQSAADDILFQNGKLKPFTNEERLYYQFFYPATLLDDYDENKYESAMLLHANLKKLGLYTGSSTDVESAYLPDPDYDYRADLAGEEQPLKTSKKVFKQENLNGRPVAAYGPSKLPFLWFAMNHLLTTGKRITDKTNLVRLRKLSTTSTDTVGYMCGFDRPHDEWAYAILNNTTARMPADEDIPRTFSYFVNNGKELRRVENLNPKDEAKQKELFGRLLQPFEWKYIYHATIGGSDGYQSNLDEKKVSPGIYLEKDRVMADNLLCFSGRSQASPLDTEDNAIRFFEKPTVSTYEKMEDGQFKIKFIYDTHLFTTWPTKVYFPAGEYVYSNEDAKKFTTFLFKEGTKPHLVKTPQLKVSNKNIVSYGVGVAPGQRTDISEYVADLMQVEEESKTFDNNKFKIFGVLWEIQRGFPVKNRGDIDSVYHAPITRRERHKYQPYLDWTGDPATSVFKYPDTSEMSLVPALTTLYYRKPEQADFWNRLLIHSRGGSGTFNQNNPVRIAFLHDERGMIIRPNAPLADVMAKKPEAFLPPYHLIVEKEEAFDETQHYLLGANQVAYFRKDLMQDELLPGSSREIGVSELRNLNLDNNIGNWLAGTYKTFTFNPGDTLSPDEARAIFQTFTCPPSFFAEHFAENKNLNSYVETTDPTPTNQQKVWFYAMDSGYYVTEVFDLTGVGYQNLDLDTEGLKVRYIDDGKDRDAGGGNNNKIWLSKMGGIQMGSGFTIDITKRQEFVSGLSFKEQVKRFNHYGISIVPGPSTELKDVDDYWQSYFGRK